MDSAIHPLNNWGLVSVNELIQISQILVHPVQLAATEDDIGPSKRALQIYSSLMKDMYCESL